MKRNLCFVLQTKNWVKKINSVKANLLEKKVFRHGFDLAQ